MKNSTSIFLLIVVFISTACHRETPEQKVHRIMTDRMVTLAIAESCTGGTIAARFTALPGASAYFKCGIVTYCNETKSIMLNICPDTLYRYGAVSETAVRLMAENVRRAAKADYAIATTGIAGPTGGTKECPVGSVWIAVATSAHTTSRLIHADGDRNTVIQEAGSAVIELLEEVLQQE